MKFFNKKNKLFPSIEPFDSGFITQGVHEIYYEPVSYTHLTLPTSDLV